MGLPVLIPLVALGLLCVALAAMVGVLALRRAGEGRTAAILERHRALLAAFRTRCRELRDELRRRDRTVRKLTRTVRRLQAIIRELHAARHEDREAWQPLRHEVLEEQLTALLDRAQEVSDSLDGRDQQLLTALSRAEEVSAGLEQQLADVQAELVGMRYLASDVADEVHFAATSQRVRERTGPPTASGTG